MTRCSRNQWQHSGSSTIPTLAWLVFFVFRVLQRTAQVSQDWKKIWHVILKALCVVGWGIRHWSAHKLEDLPHVGCDTRAGVLRSRCSDAVELEKREQRHLLHTARLVWPRSIGARLIEPISLHYQQWSQETFSGKLSNNRRACSLTGTGPGLGVFMWSMWTRVCALVKQLLHLIHSHSGCMWLSAGWNKILCK